MRNVIHTLIKFKISRTIINNYYQIFLFFFSTRRLGGYSPFWSSVHVFFKVLLFHNFEFVLNKSFEDDLQLSFVLLYLLSIIIILCNSSGRFRAYLTIFQHGALIASVNEPFFFRSTRIVPLRLF